MQQESSGVDLYIISHNDLYDNNVVPQLISGEDNEIPEIGDSPLNRSPVSPGGPALPPMTQLDKEAADLQSRQYTYNAFLNVATIALSAAIPLAVTGPVGLALGGAVAIYSTARFVVNMENAREFYRSSQDPIYIDLNSDGYL